MSPRRGRAAPACRPAALGSSEQAAVVSSSCPEMRSRAHRNSRGSMSRPWGSAATDVTIVAVVENNAGLRWSRQKPSLIIAHRRACAAARRGQFLEMPWPSYVCHRVVPFGDDTGDVYFCGVLLASSLRRPLTARLRFRAVAGDRRRVDGKSLRILTWRHDSSCAAIIVSAASALRALVALKFDDVRLASTGGIKRQQCGKLRDGGMGDVSRAARLLSCIGGGPDNDAENARPTSARGASVRGDFGLYRAA